MAKLILEKQDLTYLQWSHIRSSSGTAGTFLKATSSLHGKKKYYKLSNFDSVKGIVGHECINEIIVDRLLWIFGIDHLEYELINADIEIEGKVYSTYLCASEDFKERGESKIALDDYYRANAEKGESHYDFCKRQGCVYCIIKVPKVAETIPQSCMRNFPIIADAVWYFPKPIYRM